MLLRRLGVKTLIMTGVAADVCIATTAFDGYFRDYQIIIPKECVEAFTEKIKAAALDVIMRVVGNVVSLSDVLNELDRIKT
jgi:nicotinamidase-related amidase